MSFSYHVRTAVPPVPATIPATSTPAQTGIYLNFRDYDDDEMADEAVEHFYRVDFDDLDEDEEEKRFRYDDDDFED
jgi:hypothetical protein